MIHITGGVRPTAGGRQTEPVDLLVDADRIVEVAPRLDHPPDAQRIDATGCLVLPGLVNGHMHAHNNLFRGVVGEWTLEDFLNHIPALTVGRAPEDEYVSTMLGAVEMLKHGCTATYDLFTAFPAHSDEGAEAVARAYLDSGMRVLLAPQMVDRVFLHTVPGLLDALPDELRRSLQAVRPAAAQPLLDVAERIVRRWRGAGEGRLEVALAPSIPVGCTDEFLEGIARLRRKLDVAVHTHLDETRVQAAQARRRWGASATRHLADIGLLDDRFVGAHAVWVTGEDLAILAGAGASIVHNPASNLRIGSGIAPIREALDRGVNVALGTDGSAASDSLDMFSAMRIAALVNRVRFGYRQDRWLSARHVYEMATGGSARALGLAADAGALEPDRKADIVLVRFDTVEMAPVNDVINAVVFRDAGQLVEKVLVGGRLVVDGGRVLTVDEASVQRRAEAAARRQWDRRGELWELAEAVEPHLSSVCRGLAAEVPDTAAGEVAWFPTSGLAPP